MASVTTSKLVKSVNMAEARPFSLLEHESLLSRLRAELVRALSELARDPRGFLLALFTDKNKDRKRRRLLRFGLGLGLLVNLAFIGAMIAADRLRPANAEENPLTVVKILAPTDFTSKPEKIEVPKTEAPKGDGKKSGGGGGGQQAGRRATGGVLPQVLATLPIIKLNAVPKPDPKLAVNPNIQGPDSTTPPPADATIGVPNAKMDEPPSPGTGTGGGLGNGRGPGVGNNDGPGGGPGGQGGTGGGKYGSPDGGLSEIAYHRIPEIRGNAYTPFQWLYRPRPVVTPEAQENKVIGTVIMKVTLTADGRVTDIEVVNPVSYMTESAIESLRRSKFRPAMVNGRPITLTRVPIQIQVHF